MNVGYAIFTVLHGDSDVEGMVSARIYPDVVQRHAALPAITYTLDNVTPTDTKETTTGWDEVFISITAYGLTRASCEELSSYVRIAMDRKYGIKGTDTWITSNYLGESWDYIDDGSRPESDSKRTGIPVTNMNYRFVIQDTSDYAPGSGSVSTNYVRKGDSTLTLVTGSNTLTHNKLAKLRTLIVSDSTNSYNYMPNWINVDENEATIEWVPATLINAKIKYSY